MTIALKASKVGNAELAERIAKKIGIPLDTWYGNCHDVSLAIVRAGIFHGPEGQRVRVARGMADSVPGQHSWISLGDPYFVGTRFVDPTWWAWNLDHPEITTCYMGDELYVPHGARSIWDWGKPVSQGGPSIELTPAEPFSRAASDFVDLLRPLDRAGWSMLANAPVLGWPAKEIFAAYATTEGLSEQSIPIDIRGMLGDDNPGDLYW
jgi:hypothetical protein